MKNEKWYWFVTSEGKFRAFANWSLSYNPGNFRPSDNTGYDLVNGRLFARNGSIQANYLFSLPEGMTIEIKGRNWLIAWLSGETELYCKLVRV